jgi:hypothetical protein
MIKVFPCLKQLNILLISSIQEIIYMLIFDKEDHVNKQRIQRLLGK